MAEINEASPICRGKNLTWETVLLFFNNMPKVSMPKAEFHKICEARISGWTQTHSQIARQLAFYYEENGICYPRFKESASMKELLAYIQNWACNYFIPNPYCPSLAGKQPSSIYHFLSRSIESGKTDFNEALDKMLDVKLSSHDKVKVYLNDFTDILIDEKGQMSKNLKVNLICRIKEPTNKDASEPKTYFEYYSMETPIDIKEQFEYYLRNCINSTRRQGTQYRYGDSAIASYMSYMKADVFFAYNRSKWTHIQNSLFEITGINEIDSLTSTLLEDNDFVKYDENRGQWAIKTLLIYNAFLHARDYFNGAQSLPEESEASEGNNIDKPLQQIFYGAPGTGKSHTIETETKGKEVIRITFHPDSDYSTFVGAYKPSMEKSVSKQRKDLSLQDLASILNGYYNDPELGNIVGLQKFVLEYCSYLNGDIMAANVTQLLQLAGVSTSYNVEVNKYVKFCRMLPKQKDRKIIYKFVPQAFIQAYTKAWKDLSKPVYLVIEEINRGNCAQIFGDIFQLLDRNEFGYSSYEITPNEDIMLYLSEYFEYNEIDIKAPVSIKNGEKMILPPNLFIWATMNTSDQSLFPIDSAFKRRWDWKYMPIDTEKETWSISVNGKSYSWSSFLKKINHEIQETTSSEDKMLGFYFCKAEKNVITADRFVSKVLFYLYNDVFKDYGLDSRSFFKDKENGDKVISFQNLYISKDKLNEVLVEKLLINLNVEVFDTDKISEDDVDDEGPTEGRHLFLKAVEFEDDTFSIENGLTHFSVYLETLKKIGIPNVVPVIEASKYKRKGCKLASKEQEDGIKNSRFSYVEVDGYYIVKGAADETLINVLEEVKEKLNLKINILTYRNVPNN